MDFLTETVFWWGVAGGAMFGFGIGFFAVGILMGIRDLKGDGANDEPVS